MYQYVIPVICVCVGYKNHKMPQEWEARLRNYDSLSAITKQRINTYSSSQARFLTCMFNSSCNGETPVFYLCSVF